MKRVTYKDLSSDSRGGLFFTLVVLLYFASSLVQYHPVNPRQAEGLPHVNLGFLYLAPPMVLSGDSPHYLVELNSIIEDGDLNVANNYQQARDGDWDAGVRFRGIDLLRHVDVRLNPVIRNQQEQAGVSQYSIHPPFLAFALAPFVYPLRGGPWVEPVSIWIIMGVTLASLWFFARKTGNQARWALLLALATPLWCYSRDFWTEPWTAAAWIGLLFANSLWATGILAFCGVLIRYPFLVAVAAMAGVALWKRDLRRSAVLAGCGMAALVAAFLFAQYEFRDVGHFSLFHMGWHLSRTGSSPRVMRFAFPGKGLVGLLLDPEEGLLPFFPFLLWGFARFRDLKYLPAVAFYVFHAFSPGWGAGTGFSARYLVPVLPVLVLAVSESRPRTRLFLVAVGWSLLWGFLGGFLPAVVYDRNVWGVFKHVWANLPL